MSQTFSQVKLIFSNFSDFELLSVSFYHKMPTEERQLDKGLDNGEDKVRQR